MESNDEFQKRIDIAVKILKNCYNIIAFTGAGISTESGIPDFRGKNGIWKKVDPKTATIQYFLENPGRYWKRSAGLDNETPLIKELSDIEPNDGHLALAKLAKMGKLKAVITQNVDSLHQKAFQKFECEEVPVIELHGTRVTAHCMDCKTKYPRKEVLEWVKEGEIPPRCRKENCDGLLKSSTVLFGEQLPPGAIQNAFSLAQDCDCVIALGSTLTVFPASHVPVTAKENGAKFLIFNYDPTDMDFMADLTINGKLGDILPKIIEGIEH